MLLTYFGFALGAINTLILYPWLLQDEYYGLVSTLLSASTVLTPLFTWGLGSALIRFMPRYREEEKDPFLSFSLLTPLKIILPAFLLALIFQNYLGEVLFQRQTQLLSGYTFVLLLIAVFIAYFEIFYAYVRSMLRSVYGNFYKEVFHRMAIGLLLGIRWMQWIDDLSFVYLLALVYGLRMALMVHYAYKVRPFKIKAFKSHSYRSVIQYATFTVLTASATALTLEIDKVMLPQFEAIRKVAYYAVAGFIGITVSVPFRSMQQITTPLVAKAFADGDEKSLADLYRRSSVNLMIVGGLLFVLINTNITALFSILKAEYRGGEIVVLFISLAKLYDMSCGLNGAILSMSKHYRWDLLFSSLIIVLTIVSNLIFIPIYGPDGAALATLITIVAGNTLRLLFVRQSLKLWPFTRASLITAVLIGLSYWGMKDLHFEAMHPLLEILVKGSITAPLFLLIVGISKISPDFNDLMSAIFKKLKA